MARNLTSNITSYDLLKTFAVLIMLTDHIGAYFFHEVYPDDLWWRAVGRIGFPVWFFLVGYARGRDIPPKLIGGALVLLAANVVVGMPLFPLNALVSMIIIRLVLENLTARMLKNRHELWVGACMLTVLAVPTNYMFEYGTLGIITAIFGFMVRNREQIANNKLVVSYMMFSLAVFVFYQQYFFNFTMPQFVFVAVGTAIVRCVLFYFQPLEFPVLTQRCSRISVAFIQLCGRYTLEIYVIHLFIFKIVSLASGAEGLAFMSLRWL